jgi:hypothetical protein
MSTVAEAQTTYTSESTGDEENFDYKALSRSAVVSIVFAVIGVLAWESVYLVVLPLVAVIAGFSSLNLIERYKNELTGKKIALIGVLLGGFMVLASPIRHTIIYFTEVPDGYERVSFSVLKSPSGAPDLPTLEAAKLDGKKIFLKGYIHPTSLSTKNAKTFIIVPDWATCCFGGQPPLTHMIEVHLLNDKYASKSIRQHSIAGTFTLIPNGKHVEGLNGVYYQLEADHFQ